MGGIELTSGLAVGLAFGYALQRGRFCVQHRVSRHFDGQGFDHVQGLGAGGDRPDGWGHAVVGAWLHAHFGAAILVGGQHRRWTDVRRRHGAGRGVSSGTCYRVGEGMAGSVLALTGFGLGILLADRGRWRLWSNFSAPTLFLSVAIKSPWPTSSASTQCGWGWRSPPPWAFGCGGAGQAIADTPVAIGRGTFRGSPWAPSASPRGSVHRLWAGNLVCP